MPSLPPYRCLDCGAIAQRHGRCERCEAQRQAEHNAASHRWVYRHPKWRKLRRMILERERWCRAGCGRPARDIDHYDRLIDVLARGEDPFDVSTLAPLCRQCHATKTLWETGRAPRPDWMDRIRGIATP